MVAAAEPELTAGVAVTAEREREREERRLNYIALSHREQNLLHHI